jgi:hypothetical protein
MGKREAVSVAEKNTCAHVKNILVQRSKILPTISPFYGVNLPSVGAVLDIFSVRKRNGRMRCECVKWLKGTRLEDFKDASVNWIWQVKVRNGTANDEVIKEQVKVLGQQISVKNFVHKNYYIFC